MPQLCLNLMRNSCQAITISRTRPRNTAPAPPFTTHSIAATDTDYQGWHSPSSLAGILARSASISSSKGGIGVSEYFGITLKISLTMSASQHA